MPQAAGVAVAGWITGGVATSAAIGATAAIASAAASAAVTGAIIGAATSLVTGGDVLSGALKGAAIGAVTGAVVSGVGMASESVLSGPTGGDFGGTANATTNVTGTQTIGENAFGNPVSAGSTGVNSAGTVINPASKAAQATIQSAVQTPQVKQAGLLSRGFNAIAPSAEAKGEIIGSAITGTAQAGGSYLAAKEEADAARELAEWNEKQSDINRSEAAPARFQTQTANIEVPDWWTSQLEKRGLLA